MAIDPDALASSLRRLATSSMVHARNLVPLLLDELVRFRGRVNGRIEANLVAAEFHAGERDRDNRVVVPELDLHLRRHRLSTLVDAALDGHVGVGVDDPRHHPLTRRLDDPSVVTPLALVLGGGLGNLCDRVLRDLDGHVVDFIDLSFWPTFNVADIAISFGVILIVINGMRQRPDGAPA